ncbi:hypothetical protein DQQ10_01955 [Pseudochryseolinea flava]|uniref:DJ-1/PfpI domain-containing protein n=2 Tax=Pseudochryseolinea flava TaxID=2059302 RepID=A0A364Y9G1_9BACT|nr:hypothetical protein DQQ10_01955 [Pseudochryseolinea flava]
MKHLTILVPEGENNLSSIVGSLKIFSRANDVMTRAGRQPVFKIELAGLSDTVRFHGNWFSAHPINIKKIKRTDLIIIPSLNHNYQKSIPLNQKLVEWIKNRYDQGAEVASICTGAFLLASAGILDGKECSTHWAAYNHFRKLFPNVKLVYDRIITDQGGVYTNGGAFSFLNLMLYLVEKYSDRDIALFCSKTFQIDIDRKSQSPFTIF